MDPRIQHSKFTILLRCQSPQKLPVVILLPCHCALGHAPHLQLIAICATSLQDWASEPVGNLNGVGQVNEEEQEGEQWFRARIPTSWCQSGASRYNVRASIFRSLCQSALAHKGVPF